MYNRGKPQHPLEKNNEPNESSYMLRDKKSSSLRRDRIAAAQNEDWGWYVVSGCAFANFLLPGMLRSFGPDVLEGFAETHGLETRWVCPWIPTVFDLTFSIAGAISCFLCELTSYRTVTLWGGLLASVGMMSSLFANSILYLYISYGIVVGFGAGICYPAGILIVNEYFSESRGLANGLSLVGTTVGSIALPPYIKFLTTSYSYRGGILIVSGMMLNVLACALTYRPAQDEHAAVVRFADTMTSSSSSSSSSINTRVAAATVVRVTDEYYKATASCCTSSINTRVQVTTTASTATDIVTTDEYYADAVVSSPLLEQHVHRREGVAKRLIERLQRMFTGRPTAVLMAVSAVNALSELAYGTFAATSTPRLSDTKAALWLAAADATGRVLVPTVSDHLSSGSGGGPASVYLNAIVMAVGGVVLLTAGSSRPSPATEWSLCLIATFGLASGAAVGLEPLVAVHVLGHDRLPASFSATMLAKGAAGLVVHLLFSPVTGHQDHFGYRPSHHRIPAYIALYALGSCLVAAAAGWTAALLFRPYFYVSKNGCNQYMRAA